MNGKFIEEMHTRTPYSSLIKSIRMHKFSVPVFKISSYVRSDYAAFLSLVRLGDRLEMKREGYCHWAIFVGEQFIPVEDQVEGV